MTDATTTTEADDQEPTIESVSAAPEVPEIPAPADDEPAEEPEQPEAEEEPAGGSDTKLAAEAARYRRRMRNAETERDGLKQHVRELQGEVIKQLVTGRLTNPDDFDLFVGLDNVLGADGRLDLAKLDDALEELLTDRPYLHQATPAPKQRPKIPRGVTSGSSSPTGQSSSLERAFGDTTATWADVTTRNPDETQATFRAEERNTNRRSQVQSKM